MSAYQPYQPQPRHQGRPRMTSRNKAVAAIVLSIAGLVIAAAIAGAVAAALGTPVHHAPKAAPSSAAGTATPAAAPTRTVPRILARFTGSGITNTRKFRVAGTWRLAWSYDCAAFGMAGNFAVTEDGGNDQALTLSQLGRRGHGTTYAYSDGGRHYLSVDSECAWTIKVIGTR